MPCTSSLCGNPAATMVKFFETTALRSQEGDSTGFGQVTSVSFRARIPIQHSRLFGRPDRRMAASTPVDPGNVDFSLVSETSTFSLDGSITRSDHDFLGRSASYWPASPSAITTTLYPAH